MSPSRFSLGAIAFALLVPSLASAQEPVATATKGMGDQGTFVVGADLRGFVEHSTYESDGTGEHEILFIGLNPSVDYFVTKGFSLGGELVVQRNSSTQTFFDEEYEQSSLGLGAGVRAGVHVPLSPRLSFWGRGGATYVSYAYERDEAPDTSQTNLVYDVSALALVHIVPHLFLAAGPGFAYSTTDYDNDEDVSDGESSSTSFGLRLEIGGYF